MAKNFDFIAKLKPEGFSFGSDFNRGRFIDWSRKNAGSRVGIMLLTPESGKQRRFFEGAVIPLVTYFQEDMSHRNSKDRADVREWIQLEFCPEFVKIKGKAKKVPGSTKGKLNDDVVDKVIDWLEENYGIDRADLLNPAEYKTWRDTIFSEGGPDTFIDYLIEMGRIKQK